MNKSTLLNLLVTLLLLITPTLAEEYEVHSLTLDGLSVYYDGSINETEALRLLQVFQDHLEEVGEREFEMTFLLFRLSEDTVRIEVPLRASYAADQDECDKFADAMGAFTEGAFPTGVVELGLFSNEDDSVMRHYLLQ